MYPKWKYSVSEPGKIVYSEQEEADLGPDWVDEHVGGFAVPDPDSIEYEEVKVKKSPGRPKKVLDPAPELPVS
jgi:hypothetical protein